MPSTAETITALLHCPELYALGELLPARNEVGRPRVHPGWSVLLYGALARHYRSGARAHAELHSDLVWAHVQAQSRHAGHALSLHIPPAEAPPTWAAWAQARNAHLATDHGLAVVAATHLQHAVDIAHELGLCQPARLAIPLPYPCSATAALCPL